MPLDLNDLRDSLERIRLWHERNGSPVAASLLPGLSPSEIDRGRHGFPFPLPPEVIALYGWRNGAGGNLPFVWYHEFVPLSEALDEYRQQRSWGRWEEDWFPLFWFEGECYFLKPGPESEGGGPVWFFFNEDPEVRVAYADLPTMMRTCAAYFEEGAVTLDPGGGLQEDIRRVHAIHQRYNPGIPFMYAVP